MKNFSIAALLLLTAAFSFGQAPKPALSTSKSDVYVGYIATSPDYGGFYNIRFDGGEVSYSHSVGAHLAIAATGALSFNSALNVKQFSGTLGPKYNFLTGRVRPYVTAQAGFAYQSSNNLYAADHHPKLALKTTDTESGLTYRLGAGVDYQVTRRFYWRVAQWDIQPMPWGRHMPYYLNLSSGVGFQF